MYAHMTPSQYIILLYCLIELHFIIIIIYWMWYMWNILESDEDFQIPFPFGVPIPSTAIPPSHSQVAGKTKHILCIYIYILLQWFNSFPF